MRERLFLAAVTQGLICFSGILQHYGKCNFNRIKSMPFYSLISKKIWTFWQKCCDIRGIKHFGTRCYGKIITPPWHWFFSCYSMAWRVLSSKQLFPRSPVFLFSLSLSLNDMGKLQSSPFWRFSYVGKLELLRSIATGDSFHKHYIKLSSQKSSP